MISADEMIISVDEMMKHVEPFEANPKYTSILRLRDSVNCRRLGDQRIWKRKNDGWHLIITDGDRWLSAIEHFGSYGSSNDLIEIWSSELEEANEDPYGFLTSDQAYQCVLFWLRGEIEEYQP